MNPVTQGLLKKLKDPELDAFATDWDALNDLIIEIYQQKSASFQQQEFFFELQSRLQSSYPALSDSLSPFWRKAKIKGEVVRQDPFLTLIEKSSAKEFLENWDAMKTLPAAREALNEMLIAKIENKKSAR